MFWFSEHKNISASLPSNLTPLTFCNNFKNFFKFRQLCLEMLATNSTFLYPQTLNFEFCRDLQHEQIFGKNIPKFVSKRIKHNRWSDEKKKFRKAWSPHGCSKHRSIKSSTQNEHSDFLTSSQKKNRDHEKNFPPISQTTVFGIQSDEILILMKTLSLIIFQCFTQNSKHYLSRHQNMTSLLIWSSSSDLLFSTSRTFLALYVS